MVHGVGFRFTAQGIASSVGIKGWVRNCPDGTVEVMCEGKEGDINVFMAKLKEAMSHYIRSRKLTWQEPTGEFDAFDVTYYH
jgi:acylphosphatase